MQKSYTNEIRRGRFFPIGRISSIFRSRHWSIALVLLTAIFFQSACLFRRSREPVIPASPVRIAFLPFNAPEGDSDLRWTSMAMPIMMAMIVEESKYLEPVPLWEAMRFARESSGNSRILTQEDAAYVANWLNSKWATIGEISDVKDEKISLMVDFIPPQETSVPFRYTKRIRIEYTDTHIRNAFKQFSNYISIPQPEETNVKRRALRSLRQLAEAIDREYGWTVPAEPGKAEEIVRNLSQSDMRLARILFNPSLYPFLQDK